MTDSTGRHRVAPADADDDGRAEHQEFVPGRRAAGAVLVGVGVLGLLMLIAAIGDRLGGCHRMGLIRARRPGPAPASGDPVMRDVRRWLRCLVIVLCVLPIACERGEPAPPSSAGGSESIAAGGDLTLDAVRTSHCSRGPDGLPPETPTCAEALESEQLQQEVLRVTAQRSERLEDAVMVAVCAGWSDDRLAQNLHALVEDVRAIDEPAVLLAAHHLARFSPHRRRLMSWVRESLQSNDRDRVWAASHAVTGLRKEETLEVEAPVVSLLRAGGWKAETMISGLHDSSYWTGEFVNAFQELSTDDSISVRTDVAIVLRRAPPELREQALEILRDLADDPDEEVARLARSSIEKMQGE